MKTFAHILAFLLVTIVAYGWAIPAIASTPLGLIAAIGIGGLIAPLAIGMIVCSWIEHAQKQTRIMARQATPSIHY